MGTGMPAVEHLLAEPWAAWAAAPGFVQMTNGEIFTADGFER